jgi:hypothetical protein
MFCKMKRAALAVLLSAISLGCVADPPESTDINSGAGGATGSAGSAGSGGSKSAGSGASNAGGSAGSMSSAGNGAGGASSAGSAGSTSSAGSGPSGDPYAQARQDCVDRINAFRATEGLPPYERWTSAESCIDGQAESDSISGEAHGAFGDCNENAQNECPGWGSVDDIIQDCLQDMWDEGPGQPFEEHGHYINMSSTEYTMVACGFFETTDGDIWAIQNFR